MNFKILFAMALTLLAAMALQADAAQRLLAVVNEQPITSLDIDQQVQLDRLFNPGSKNGSDRKSVLGAIIDQYVKIEEAKRYRMNASDVEIDARLSDFAKGLKTNSAGLEGKLGAQGISMETVRRHIGAQIAFARLLKYRYHEDVTASDAEIVAKTDEIKKNLNQQLSQYMADPRMKPVAVVSLIEIAFPVEAVETGGEQILLSRIAEANQFISRFKTCNAARAAASGIFNVRVGKKFDAALTKLPPKLQTALTQAGPDHAVGPIRDKTGVIVLAHCGKRTLQMKAPPIHMPERGQIEQAVLSQKLQAAERKHVAEMRKRAIIEYKDNSFEP
jgi:peptidyl-prolyl cis-trans isomerase SurA